MADDTTVARADAAGPTRKAFWKREKFWLILIIGAIPVVNEATGLNLSTETVLKVMGALGSLVGFEMIADLVKVHHESRSKRDIVVNGSAPK